MNDFPQNLKQKVLDIIQEMGLNPSPFVKNPDSDFTRKRKLDFETLLKLTLSMEGSSVKKELLTYFNFAVDTATASAYNQQRSKVHPEAFDYLFHKFTDEIESHKLLNGYRLIACDGSDINIARNPNDTDYYVQSFPSDKGFNQIHLNVFFDLLNRTYTDAVIQPRRKVQEVRSCIEMIDRSDFSEKVILIADRGYENYNIFAHAEEKNWNYVVRVKDIFSNGIVSGLNVPKEGSFDKTISLLLTRRQTKEVKSNPDKYKFMPRNQKFDYLSENDKGTYPLCFRIVRFPISEKSFETIITNLKEDEFPPMKIKDLYNLRWGVETSFRELKYAIGLTHFHAKKVDYIKQEIFARLTLYNFCEAITSHVILQQQKHTKHSYQVNFTMAIYICKHFLKHNNDMSPPDVDMLIQKHTLPVRPGRKVPRKVRPKTTVSFLYRVA